MRNHVSNAFHASVLTVSGAIGIVLTLMVLLMGLLFSQEDAAAAPPPTTMNFQGRLANASNILVADGLYNMQFRIFTVASGGSAVWTETRETTNRVQVTNGLFSVQLGQVTPLSASVFNATDLYFEITMATPATATCSTASCASWESPMTPRNKLATSAYAYNAATLNGFDETDFAAASGSNAYIQNTTTPQTANFSITGNGTANIFRATTFDRATSGTLTVGGTNATAITLADNTSVTGTLGVSSTISASNLSGTNTGDISVSGQNYLTLVGQAITANAINLGSNVTGTLPIANGGTGATTSQGAINALSQLTTNGDLLFYNGTNSTRLARGTNGQCLTSNATTVQWGSCGLSAESDTLASVTGRGATTATAVTFSGGLSATGSGTGLTVTNNATIGGTLGVTGAITGSNLSGTNTGNVTLSGQNYLSLAGQAITVNAVNLSGSNVTSTLGVANGGTGATTTQGAINAISQLTTNGDLLYYNGTNSTRLARGTNGQCLTSNATTLQWGSCGLSSESDTLASVTARGATTAVAATFSGGLTASGTGTGLAVTNNATVGGTLAVTGSITGSNLSGTNTGNVTLSGQNYLSIAGQTITAAAINLSGTHVTATLGLGNGGTGATTAQGAINAISGLTTNGDLLYHNGTNSTRLARGTNGQCLTSTSTSIQWGSCGTTGASTSLNNLASVAINTSLISDTTNTDDLGSSAITWRSGYFGTALYSPILDRANAGTLTIGGTNATAITLADNTTVDANLTVSAGNSLTLTGGNTASRPGSPTEGMVYFDSETDQLLTYANGKWQADRSDAILVAANNSSARDKAAADYIADGTADQSEINDALTAGSGKKVVLLAGTYTANATILIPNNTTLSGVGPGTIVQLADIDTTENLIENSDTSTGTGVVVRNLKLDGRSDLNTAGTQYGIALTNVGGGTGSSARSGANVTDITITRFQNRALSLESIQNSNITRNNINNISTALYLNASSNNNISLNNFQANTTYHMYLANSSNNNVNSNTINEGGVGLTLSSSSTDNVISGNSFLANSTYGVFLTGASNNTITGNTTKDSGSQGIIIASSSSGNLVSSNYIYNSGGAASNNGIQVSTNSDDNVVTANRIIDTSCTTTCYAINISSDSDNTTIEGNTYSTSSGTATINDSNGSTQYAGQAQSQNGLNTLYKQANSTTAFQIQNATGAAQLTADTTNSRLVVGTSDTTGTLLVLDTKTNAGDPTGVNGGMYYNSNANKFRCYQNGGWMDCVGANTSLSNLASTNINTALNATNNNLTLQTTTSGNVVLNAAGTIELQDNTNLSGNLTVSAGNSIRLVGGNTASRPASPAEGMVYFDSETDQLLTYANGKWKADSTDAILVAANNSSAGDKAAANYIADGTADQTEINSALTAASGKKVVLLAGTYTASATILIPNNTTLAGVGPGTIVEFADIDTADNLIENSDTSTGTGVVVRDLKLDGRNDLNTAGNQTAIYLSGLGDASTGRAGGLISNVITERFRFVSVYFINTDVSKVTESTLSSDVFNEGGVDNVISDNIFPANATRPGVLDLAANSSATITGNVFNGRNYAVQALYAGSRYVVSGNRFINNTVGVYNEYAELAVSGNQFIGGTRGISFAPYSSTIRPSNITANQFDTQTEYAIWLGGTTHVKIDSNTIKDSGGASNNNAIFLDAADNTRITDNSISDASCSTTCYAINISNSTADNNYLSGNVFSPGTINDVGTGTVYSNQSRGAGGLNPLFKQTSNSMSTFTIQNASGGNVFNVDTTNGIVDVHNNAMKVTSAGVMGLGTGTDTLTNPFGGGSAMLQIGSNSGLHLQLAENNIGFNRDGQSYLVNRSTGSSAGITIGVGGISAFGLRVNNNNETIVNTSDDVGGYPSGYTRTLTVGGTAGGSSCGSAGCPVIAINSGGASGNRWGIGVPTNGGLVFNTENGSTATTRVSISNTANITLAGTSACTIGSGTGNTSCTSDSRLKNLQGNATGNLQKILQLQPEYYTWKSDGTNTKRMGLIAQDVQQVLPEFVVRGADGYLQLDYGGLVAPLIGAVGEQQTQINALNRRVNNLQNANWQAGGTINGNLTIGGSLNVMGNASFVNVKIAQNLEVRGKVLILGATETRDITIAGHLTTKGAKPTIETKASLGLEATATVSGNDAAGTVKLESGASGVTDGELARISFAKAYGATPRVVVSALNETAAGLTVYVERTNDGFAIMSRDPIAPGVTYTFDYIVQAATN